MATIKDVAKEAGVSVATVSYYINQKPVSEEKARRILAAIQKLNYVVQSPGRDLRTSKNRMIGVIFPNLTDPYYVKIIESIRVLLNQANRAYHLVFSDDDPQLELKLIKDFIGRKYSGILLYSCQPDRPEVFAMLQKSGIPIVLLDRKPQNFVFNFVGCDNYNLFYEMTQRIYETFHQKPVLLCGPLQYTECMDAYRGFFKASSLFWKGSPTVVTTGSISREEGFRVGMKLYEEGKRPPIILSTSYLLAEGFLQAIRLNHIDAEHEVFLGAAGYCEENIFCSNPLIHEWQRPAFHIGETAVNLLLENIRNHADFSCRDCIIPNPPFRYAQEEPPMPFLSIADKTIRVLLPDDYETTKTLYQLLADFYAKERIRVQFSSAPIRDLYDMVDENLSRQNGTYDAIMFDIPYISDFAGRGYLLALDDYCKAYQIRTQDYVPGALDPSCRYSGHYYALPYLMSTQLLYYRKDLFSEETVLRQYEKQYQTRLEVPATWQQYNRISRFFTRALNPNSPTEYGNAVDSAYVCAFWNRFFTPKKPPINPVTKRVDLKSPAAIQAVKGFLEAVSTAHPSVQDHPTEAVQRLINGEVAMTVAFFNYATEIRQPSVLERIGYAQVPGGSPVLGGWVLGINRYSNNPEEAFRFIRWASSASIAVPQTILGGQSPCLKVYNNYDLLSLYPWLSTALQAFSKATSRQFVGEYRSRKSSDLLVEHLLTNEISSLIGKVLTGQMPDDQEILQALTRVDREAFP